MQFNDFESNVKQWLLDRKITQNSTAQAQFIKLVEETGELAAGIARDNVEDCEDAMGDMLVLLVSVSDQLGIPLSQCMERAWDEIKDRTGHLTEDGVFVKDGE